MSHKNDKILSKLYKNTKFGPNKTKFKHLVTFASALIDKLYQERWFVYIGEITRNCDSGKLG